MAARNSFDNAVEAQPAQVVRHPAEGIVSWVKAQQLRDQGAHLQIGEPSQLKTEDYENSQQSLDAWITEAEGGGSLPIDFDRANDLIESIFANRTVMRDCRNRRCPGRGRDGLTDRPRTDPYERS